MAQEIKNDISVSSRIKHITDEQQLKMIDFIIDYSFEDKQQVYTNGTVLVPLYRVLDAFIQNGNPYQELNNMAQQTAVELLFLDFKALSKNMRDSGDDPSANLIDYLCIKEHEAKQMEKEQIMDAYVEGINLVPCDLNSTDELDAEQYYNETFGKH